MNLTFKYQTELAQYENCPPEEYQEMEIGAWRWVKKDNLSNSFIPLNVNKYPPRGFKNHHLMCKSFGLSMFNSYTNGLATYKSLYKKKGGVSHDDFINEKGDTLAYIQLDKEKGAGGDLNTETGHFTFHEYKNVNLTEAILELIPIFDENDTFNQ